MGEHPLARSRYPATPDSRLPLPMGTDLNSPLSSQGHAGHSIPWLLQEESMWKAQGLSDLSPTRASSPQLVSLASEVQDLHLAQRKEMASGFSKGPSLGLLPDVPSLMETLSYSYCYVGIMTGECACAPRPVPCPSSPSVSAQHPGFGARLVSLPPLQCLLL